MKNVMSVFARTLPELNRLIKNSSADNTSSWSALLLWKPHPEDFKTARSCRLLIVGLSFLGIDTMSKEDILRRISQCTRKFEKEGEWSKVDEALQHPLIPFQQLELLLKDRNEDDFFGNDLPQIGKILRRMKTYNPYLPKTGKVKKPQRKRGYGDKGHLPADSLPVELRPTKPAYANLTEFIRDSSYQNIPEALRQKNDELQRGIVERASSLGIQKVIEKQEQRIRSELLEKEHRKQSALDTPNPIEQLRKEAEPGTPFP